MSDPQSEARTIARLTDLRTRLLDVRAVDRWLNVRHAGPMALHVALADEPVDGLHTLLTSGRDLIFRPVPYPDPAWEREYADDFSAALDEERALDLAWREALDAGELPGSARLRAVEIDLRARAAQKLGLPCREEHPAQVAGAWIRQQTGEPPRSPKSNGKGSKSSREPHPKERRIARAGDELQTALFWGDLRGALAQVAEEAELLHRESASDSLRVAVGFLEWTPGAPGSACQHAPLLLYPVEWARRIEGERERHGIRGLETPECNEPLRLRLESEFQIKLPVRETEESAEAYLSRVEEAVSGRKGWKVSRESFLGVFPVSPSWMYTDVDPKHWGGYHALASSGVLSLLWERPDAEAIAEQAVELERVSGDAAPEKIRVECIADADSGQERVVELALRGKNVRVDAPPGTGVTQTVINLVGSFLARGKTVLVVSERGGALDEVSRRARDLGLGAYCVELYSAGLRRSALSAALQERLGAQASDHPPEPEAESVAEAEAACKQRLEDYFKLVRQPFGQLEIEDGGRWRQATLHDVLWEDVALRSKAPPFAGLDRVWLDNIELLTRADRERTKSRLSALERSAREMREKWGGVEGHPWGFVTRGDIQIADIPDIEEVAAQALVRIEELQACGDALIARMRFDVEASTLTEVLEFARLLQSLPLPPEQVPDLLARMLLLSPEAEGRVRENLGWLRESLRRREKLARFFEGRAPEILDEEEWGDAVGAARAVGLGDIGLKGIAGGIEDLRRRIALWAQLKPFVQKCLETFGLGDTPVSVPLLSRVVQALEVLAGVERRVLLVRSAAILEEINLPILEAGLKAALALREGEEQVRSVYAYDVRLTETELREHANALVGRGLLGRWSATYRKAASQARALVKQHAGLSDAQLASRLHQLADHLEALRRFDADTTLRQLLGDRFRGALSDLESCVEANRLAASVRARFVGQWEPEASLRRFFLQGSLDDFDSALALKADPQFADLTAFLKSVENAPVGMDELVVGWEAAAEEAQRLFRFFGGLGLRAEITPNEALEVRFCYEELRELREKIDGSPLKTWVGQDAWKSDLTEPGLLETALDYTARLHAAVPAGVVRVVAAGDLDVSAEIEEVRSQGLTLEGGAMRAVAALRALQGWVADPAVPIAVSPVLAPFLTVGAVYGVLRRAQENGMELSRCVAFRRGIEELRNDGLGALLAAFEEAGADYSGLDSVYDRVMWRSLARRALELFPELGRVPDDTLEEVWTRWEDLHRRGIAQTQRRILAGLSSVPVWKEEPGAPEPEPGSAASLAVHELEPARACPLRHWLEKAWPGIQKAKPCVLASPESVAQHVAAGMLFDLVIVDSASQMRPERALGVLARGRQIVLFGDEMLLPAASFMERHGTGAMEFADQKAEIVSLWEMVDGAVETCALRGQYRAGFAALMAFSNRHFYRNEIRVLPAPRETVPEDPGGLRLLRVEGANRAGAHAAEARAVVEEALRCMKTHPGRSLAILTWNAAQRTLVGAMLARAFSADPEAARYRARWAAGCEPFVVRLVDEAQGETRDIVLVSFGLASEDGVFLEGAAPLQGSSGGRRLNVALSRSRLGTCVFCAVAPNRIRVDHRTPRGLVLLRQFLGAAAQGGIQPEDYAGACVSASERVLAAALESDGFRPAARAGSGSSRVDLAAAHSRRGLGFVLALQGDASGEIAPEEGSEKPWLRGTELARLGWRVHRVWSAEWFRDPERQAEILREFANAPACAPIETPAS